MDAGLIVIIVVAAFVAFVVWKSFHSVGATEVGLVGKRFAFRKLGEDNPIAFRGEAGYQATLLMPGCVSSSGRCSASRSSRGSRCRPARSAWSSPRSADRCRSAPRARSTRRSWRTSPTCTASSTRAVKRACSVRCCLRARSCRSTRWRSSCSPRRASTESRCRPTSPRQSKDKTLSPASFGLSPDQLRVVVIAPDVGGIDLVGVVTALEGEPLPSGDIASRLGGFEDVAAIEASNAGGSTTPPMPSSSTCCSAARTRCTTTTRTSRSSSTPAARSGSSTTRCSTARTCSTRSWCASTSCRCWS